MRSNEGNNSRANFLKALFLSAFVILLAHDSNAQQGLYCGVALPKGLPATAISSIGTGPLYFIQYPGTDLLVSCEKSTIQKIRQFAGDTRCDYWGPALGNSRDLAPYLCTTTKSKAFCDGKRAGVELQTPGTSSTSEPTLPVSTYGFCAPKPGFEARVKKRPESPILGEAEGQFHQFACQPGAADGDTCFYTTSGRYPYLAYKPGATDLKKGKCREVDAHKACTAVAIFGQRWADPTCRAAHTAKPPPPWNGDDLGRYTGPVEIGTKNIHGPNYYFHPGMSSPVKVCMPDAANGGSGGGSSGGGGGAAGGSGGGTGANGNACTMMCTTGPCTGVTNGAPNGCGGVTTGPDASCSRCQCSSDGKPACGATGGGTNGGPGGGTGSGTGGGSNGNPSGGSGGRTCAVDKCGDGICQRYVCMACGCPLPESETTCPQDCSQAGSGIGGGGSGSGSGSNGCSMGCTHGPCVGNTGCPGVTTSPDPSCTRCMCSSDDRQPACSNGGSASPGKHSGSSGTSIYVPGIGGPSSGGGSKFGN